MSAKFYEIYKWLINYQKSSNLKNKITTNVHFDIKFKLKKQRNETNNQIQLSYVDTNKRGHFKMVQHF